MHNEERERGREGEGGRWEVSPGVIPIDIQNTLSVKDSVGMG